MKIQEVAQKTGLSIHTLRYYEKEQLLPSVERLPNGHREYSQEDLYRVVFITRLRSSDMHIRDIRRFMQLVDGNNATLPERIEIMERHQAAIERRMDELAEHLSVIRGKIRHYNDLLVQGEQPKEDGC